MSFERQQSLNMITRPVRILVFSGFVLAACLVGFLVSSQDD
jgi:hypothetical protein